MKKELDYIYSIQKDISYLRGIAALLDWDEKTHMPKDAASDRGEQTKILSAFLHDKVTDNKFYTYVNKLAKKKLSFKDRTVVNRLQTYLLKHRRISRELVKELSMQEVLASAAWQKAREKNKFDIFKPELEKIIKLKRREARYLNPKLSIYDSLLEEHEEGMRSDRLTALFGDLKNELVTLLNQIKSTKRYKNQKKHAINMTPAEQRNTIELMIQKMGLPENRLAFDASAHPFTLHVSADDVRITTRFIEPTEAFLAGVHEAGHAMYELNLPRKFQWTIIFDAASFGLHESQSRFWENIVCRSEHFWKGYFKYFKKQAKGSSWQEFYRSLNIVRPSFIRVNADEVTYPLHIILRFEIERDLILGKLNVNQVKSAWNKKFKEMFGITPRNDNEGILQDVHWSFGAFGYFPTYAIGTIYASQIHKRMKQEMRSFDSMIENQRFDSIREWLIKNIHSKGKTMLADDIIKQATGSGLDVRVFIDYLKDKYATIYGF